MAYPQTTIDAVQKDYETEDLAITAICKAHGIAPNTVLAWARKGSWVKYYDSPEAQNHREDIANQVKQRALEARELRTRGFHALLGASFSKLMKTVDEIDPAVAALDANMVAALGRVAKFSDDSLQRLDVLSMEGEGAAFTGGGGFEAAFAELEAEMRAVGDSV